MSTYLCPPVTLQDRSEHSEQLSREVMMGEGNGVESVIMLTFTKSAPMLTQLGLWLASWLS